MLEEPAYQTAENPSTGSFDVLSPSGHCVLSCKQQREAEQYATILSQAYQAGYRQGYRAARQSR